MECGRSAKQSHAWSKVRMRATEIYVEMRTRWTNVQHLEILLRCDPPRPGTVMTLLIDGSKAAKRISYQNSITWVRLGLIFTWWELISSACGFFTSGWICFLRGSTQGNCIDLNYLQDLVTGPACVGVHFYILEHVGVQTYKSPKWLVEAHVAFESILSWLESIILCRRDCNK